MTPQERTALASGQPLEGLVVAMSAEAAARLHVAFLAAGIAPPKIVVRGKP
jgi:hypothetical protein